MIPTRKIATLAKAAAVACFASQAASEPRPGAPAAVAADKPWLDPGLPPDARARTAVAAPVASFDPEVARAGGAMIGAEARMAAAKAVQP